MRIIHIQKYRKYIKKRARGKDKSELRKYLTSVTFEEDANTIVHYFRQIKHTDKATTLR